MQNTSTAPNVTRSVTNTRIAVGTPTAALYLPGLVVLTVGHMLRIKMQRGVFGQDTSSTAQINGAGIEVDAPVKVEVDCVGCEGETGVDDAPLGDAPVDDGPVGDAPVDGGSVGDGPVGDAPVEDGPVGDGPVGEDPVGDGPVDGDPVDDGPVGDGDVPELEMAVDDAGLVVTLWAVTLVLMVG